MEKTFAQLPHGWYENERRLYVWFIICFMQLKLIDPLRFVDAYEKYWRHISETFWKKEVYFLKYQLLNIIKTKGRTLWKADEDQILRLAYRYASMNQENIRSGNGTRSLRHSTNFLMENISKPPSNVESAGRIT